MDVPFAILTCLTLASAIAAMSLRNLVHCALCLVVTFASLAGFYLQLNAQFVGFAQILVYIGAVAILIVIAILLTRSADSIQQPIVSASWAAGIGVALLVFGAFVLAIVSSSIVHRSAPAAREVTVRAIGDQLMTNYVLALEVTGLLLTAAMIGAVIIALREPPQKSPVVQSSSSHAPVPASSTASQVLEATHH
jgi:NADH-quinone oxidoreductase subunit J